MTDFIEIYDNVLPPELCQKIIDRFESSDKVFRGLTGQGVDTSKKDSYDLTITYLPEWQDISMEVMQVTLEHLKQYMGKYVFTLVGALSPAVVDPQTGQTITITDQNFEQYGRPRLGSLLEKLYGSGPVNVQKYNKGSWGYHHWHSEIYPQADTNDALYRVLYYQYYLNTVEEGGETQFYYQDKNIRPQQGRLVIAPAGFTHTHKGHVPVSDDKYIITSWVMFQSPKSIYS